MLFLVAVSLMHPLLRYCADVLEQDYIGFLRCHRIFLYVAKECLERGKGGRPVDGKCSEGVCQEKTVKTKLRGGLFWKEVFSEVGFLQPSC